jgi:hypothetical protein
MGGDEPAPVEQRCTISSPRRTEQRGALPVGQTGAVVRKPSTARCAPPGWPNPTWSGRNGCSRRFILGFAASESGGRLSVGSGQLDPDLD